MLLVRFDFLPFPSLLQLWLLLESEWWEKKNVIYHISQAELQYVSIIIQIYLWRRHNKQKQTPSTDIIRTFSL